jgi:hypothetical protein
MCWANGVVQHSKLSWKYCCIFPHTAFLHLGKEVLVLVDKLEIDWCFLSLSNPFTQISSSHHMKSLQLLPGLYFSNIVQLTLFIDIART